jgi:aspartyl-tRNA(Asn)/glutamyl-tRNA(Gln) amidotransferase subunit C
LFEKKPFWGLRLEPMKVTDKDVAHVADLANLELTEEECARMLRDLNSILEYVERLSELETDKVAPMAQVSDRYGENNDESRQGSGRFAYAIREDVKDGLRKSLPHDVAVKNAPDTDGTFFEVPKVIER